MDQPRFTLWYEDLDRHRQPSLYYLSTEDDSSGPHLICDWNGAPTDFDEFDIDMMGKFIEQTDATNGSSKDYTCPSLDYNVEEDEIKFSQTILPKRYCSQTILSEEDGSEFNFLTVPPIARSLIKRLLKSQPIKRPHPIPEEPELTAMNGNANKKHGTTTEATKKRQSKSARPIKEVQTQA